MRSVSPIAEYVIRSGLKFFVGFFPSPRMSEKDHFRPSSKSSLLRQGGSGRTIQKIMYMECSDRPTRARSARGGREVKPSIHSQTPPTRQLMKAHRHRCTFNKHVQKKPLKKHPLHKRVGNRLHDLAYALSGTPRTLSKTA